MDEYCLYLRKSRIDLEAEANGQGRYAGPAPGRPAQACSKARVQYHRVL